MSMTPTQDLQRSIGSMQTQVTPDTRSPHRSSHDDVFFVSCHKSIPSRIEFTDPSSVTEIFATMITPCINTPSFAPNFSNLKKFFGRRTKQVSPQQKESENGMLPKKKSKNPSKPRSLQSTTSDKTSTSSLSASSYATTTGVSYADIYTEFYRYTPYYFHQSQISAMPHESFGF
jgi:hypothetical protein